MKRRPSVLSKGTIDGRDSDVLLLRGQVGARSSVRWVRARSRTLLAVCCCCCCCFIIVGERKWLTRRSLTRTRESLVFLITYGDARTRARVRLKRMEMFSLFYPQTKWEYLDMKCIARISSRACDSPLSSAGSELRDGQTGVKKRTYVRSECCVRAGFAWSKPGGWCNISKYGL